MSHENLKTVRQLTTLPTSRQRRRWQVTLLWKPQLKIQAYPDIPIMSGLLSSKGFCLPEKHKTARTHTDTLTRKPDCRSWERRISRNCFVTLFPKCVQCVIEWLSTSSGTRVAKSGLEVGHLFKPVLRAIRLAEQSSHTSPSTAFKMPY